MTQQSIFGQRYAEQPVSHAQQTPPPLPQIPIGRVSRAIIRVAHTFATLIALALWIFPIGPIWLAMLMRVIAVFGYSTIIGLFTGKEPPNPARLDAIAAFWVLGFNRILTLRTSPTTVKTSWYGDPPPEESGTEWDRRHQMDWRIRLILAELAAACFFYIWILSALYYVPYGAAAITWLIEWILYIVAFLVKGIAALVAR